MLISGYLENGQPCSQVNVDLYLRNSEVNDIVHIDTSTKRSYEPGDKARLSGKASIDSKLHRKDWYVSNIFLNCL